PTPRPPLTRAHLIAVQPLSQKLADELLATEPRFSILTGHYTQVENSPKVTFPKPPGSPEKIDLGAIQMARRYASQAKPVGFIEGKISPYSGIPEGPRSHVNGVLAGGGPYSARAEAWEFFFYRGAILDHWGYLTSGGNIHPTVAAIRQQLAALKTFMSGLPLARLKTSAIDTTTGRPLWIVGGDLGPYPDEEEPWDAERSSQRFFGALQTNENDATGRWFLLYMHHSTRRCYAPPKAAEPDFTAAGCDDDDNPGTAAAPPGNYMVLGGYDARLWTTPQSKRYRETLHVNLGPNPGTFDVLWIKPENLQVVKQQAVAWKQSSCSLPGCVVCSNPTTGNPCSIGLSATEGYDYDIALKIVQR
ncbi:MAG TPA: hypothetical protein DD490_13075, partial [Acidobacteria bacterium]|nr:hypothetical protein [Acidobacteriota bacterium]